MNLSIVTICKNEVKRIEKTLFSVFEQTFKDYQYIIIDGGSNDGTKEIIRKYEHKFDVIISEPDDGIYNAMNKAIDYCRGEYIYFLNSGDILYSRNTLEKIFSYGIKGEIVFGNIAIKELDGKQSLLTMPNKLTIPFLSKKTIPHQATFTKKGLFEKVGKYEEKYTIAADYKFSLKAIYEKNCSVQYIPEIFAIFDCSGFGTLNVEKREREKKLAQREVFSSLTFWTLILVQKIGIINRVKDIFCRFVKYK